MTPVCQAAARRIGCTANGSGTVTHSLKRRMSECPRCRDRWLRPRLTAKYANAICPRCRSRIAWRINAYAEGRWRRQRWSRLRKTARTI